MNMKIVTLTHVVLVHLVTELQRLVTMVIISV